MIKFALAGNPNSGKTTLFNTLTKSTAYVGNWPGVTVDKLEGYYKKLPEKINVVDLPGIYSLSPYSPEEVISRNFILDENVNCVINIVDATNLERNLYLTTQLLEMDVPVVVALNMCDLLENKHQKIDIDKLQQELGVPVVEISALKQKNIHKLMKVAYDFSKEKRVGKTIIQNKDLKHLINDCTIAFKGKEVSHPLFHAIKLIELDEIEVKNHGDLVKIVKDFKQTFKDDVFADDFEAIVADARYKYISKKFNDVIFEQNEKSKKVVKKETGKLSKSDKIDKIFTNKFVGIPIFLVFMFVIFHFTFSENFLFLNKFIHEPLGFKSAVEGVETFFEELFATEKGLNSPGVFLQSLLMGCLENIRVWILKLLGPCEGAEWIPAFIGDGLLEGLLNVLSFVPQILLLFLFFCILEDTGYMARVAFILDRIFRKFGLSGRSFMPMIMGFGCSIPAMVNTRTLADEKERIATIRVIPFFSCQAKLPILLACAGAIVAQFSFSNTDLIVFSMYILGMVTAIITLIVMRHTSLKGDVPPFIMELPAYHAPQFKSLMIHLWDKLKHFIKKAFTIILVSTILIWLFLHFTWDWKMLEDAEIDRSIIASLGQFIKPLFTPFGFGNQLNPKWGWVFAVAAITGLVAKENVIATFGVLAACIAAASGAGEIDPEEIEDVAKVQQMIIATGISKEALLAYIAFNMTTIPCFAAVATAKAELPKGQLKYTIGFWLLTSAVVSSAIYIIGKYWWTAFIYIVLAVLIGLLIYIYNKKFRNRKLKLS